MARATRSGTWVSPSSISLHCVSVLPSSHPGPSDVCTHHPPYCHSLSYSAFPLRRLVNSHSDSRSQGRIIWPPRRHQISLFTNSYGKMSLLFLCFLLCSWSGKFLCLSGFMWWNWTHLDNPDNLFILKSIPYSHRLRFVFARLRQGRVFWLLQRGINSFPLPIWASFR